MAVKFNLLSASGKGKGLKIFDSGAYKEHEQTPLAREFWTIRWTIIIWLIAALMFICAFPIEHVWRYGWSPATQHWIWVYLENLIASFGVSALALTVNVLISSTHFINVPKLPVNSTETVGI